MTDDESFINRNMWENQIGMLLLFWLYIRIFFKISVSKRRAFIHTLSASSLPIVLTAISLMTFIFFPLLKISVILSISIHFLRLSMVYPHFEISDCNKYFIEFYCIKLEFIVLYNVTLLCNANTLSNNIGTCSFFGNAVLIIRQTFLYSFNLLEKFYKQAFQISPIFDLYRIRNLRIILEILLFFLIFWDNYIKFLLW